MLRTGQAVAEVLQLLRRGEQVGEAVRARHTRAQAEDAHRADQAPHELVLHVAVGVRLGRRPLAAHDADPQKHLRAWAGTCRHGELPSRVQVPACAPSYAVPAFCLAPSPAAAMPSLEAGACGRSHARMPCAGDLGSRATAWLTCGKGLSGACTWLNVSTTECTVSASMALRQHTGQNTFRKCMHDSADA